MKQRNPWLWGRDYGLTELPVSPEPPVEEPVVEPVVLQPQDPDPETTTVQVVGLEVTGSVQVITTTPGAVEEPVEQPWARLTTHAQIDDLVNDKGIATPDGWASMTIALKKAWLDDYVAAA